MKLLPQNISCEINVTRLREEKQILIVLKETSNYKRMQKSKTKDQLTNLFINSTAHNIFTPINGITGICDLLKKEIGENRGVLRYIMLLKTCLNSLIFNSQNLIEHSKIRLKRF